MVSVIIPVFEQPMTLKALIGAMSEQKCDEPFEVLVCDDGSSADLVSAVRGARNLDIRHIWQPHQGFRAARSRNNGIRCAQGRLLIFLDGDMLAPPEFLSRHIEAHRRHGASPFVVCGTRRPLGHKAPSCFAAGPDSSICPEEKGEATRETQKQRRWIESEYPWMAMLSCNFSVNRAPEVLFDEQFVGWGSEDRELAFRLHLRGYRFALHEETEAFHVENRPGGGQNPMETGKHEHIATFLRNKLYYRSLYSKADLDPAMRVLLRFHLDCSTDIWHIGEPVEGGRIEDVIALAEDWARRNGIQVPPVANSMAARERTGVRWPEADNRPVEPL